MGVWAVLISLLLISSPTLACSSNCYQCHSNVPEDKNHQVLGSCMHCHPNHPEKGMSACGADCFDCHNYKKVMSSSKAHRVLVECIECHGKLKRGELPSYYRELLGG